MKKLILASDHGGFELKQKIKAWLLESDQPIKDIGVKNGEPSDHPLLAQEACQLVLENPAEEARAILVCGSGQGMCMTANRHKGIRAILAGSVEIAKLGREHNNANVLCLGGRFIEIESAKQIITAFLNTEFLGGKYQTRIEMLDA